MQNINLTPVIEALLGLLATVITCWLVPVLRAKLSAERREQLRVAIRSAVYTAEQLFGAGRGEEKLDYALAWLREQGYEIDSRQVEAAVYALLNQFREGAEKGKPPDAGGAADEGDWE